MSRLAATFLIAAGLAAPVLAQTADMSGRTPQQEYQRGYAAPAMPNQAAIDAQSQPAVAALNQESGAAAAVASSDRTALSDANRAQYEADRVAYMDALIRHDANIDRTNTRWTRQQNAYADAMATWRAQVASCKAGHRRACDMPTPDPADFY